MAVPQPIFNFNAENFTLNPQEVQFISEAIFDYVLQYSELQEHHEIVTGLQWAQQIAIIGQLGLAGVKRENCQPGKNLSGIPLSEKFWYPTLIGDRYEICTVTDYDAMLKLFGKYNRVNPDFFNWVDSPQMKVVLGRVLEAFMAAMQRLVWFGDTLADTVANSGYLTNGTDPAFFTPFDGFWAQIFNEIAANRHVIITENTAATYALQQDLPTDFSFNLFRDMWAKADPRFKQAAANRTITPVIHCTSAIAENWVNYRESQSLAFTLQNAESGGFRDIFRNIKIVPRYDWDSIIQTYFDNGTTWNLPNRALLASKENLQVGTLSTSDFGKLDAFYDKYHGLNVIDWNIMLDAKIPLMDMVVVAY